jgi:hypothetical protein
MSRAALVLLLLVAGCVSRPAADGSVRVAVSAVPLDPRDPAAASVGKLRYLGGVALKARDRRFGGLSGLRVRADGWALAVSDAGHWVAFRPVESSGRLTGVADVRIAPLLDAQGRAAAGKAAGDAEALEWLDDGTAIVAFEGDHRLQVYPGVDPARADGLAVRPSRVERPAALRGWPANGGAEAFTELGPSGDLLLGEEPGPDGLNPAVAQFDGAVVTTGYRPPADSSRPTPPTSATAARSCSTASTSRPPSRPRLRSSIPVADDPWSASRSPASPRRLAWTTWKA